MKLAIVLPSLTGGGTERMRLNLIREWLLAGVSVDLVVAKASGQLVCAVPPDLRLIEVAAGGPLNFVPGLRSYLREHRPTHLLVAGYDIAALTLLALPRTNTGAPVVVVSVHSHPSAEAHWGTLWQRLKLRVSFRLIRQRLTRCTAVVAVSHGIAEDLAAGFGFPRQKLRVIPNPVLTEESFARSQEPLKEPAVVAGKPWILFAGRLEHQKGLDVLLTAFRSLSGQSDAELVLLGDGSLRELLVSQARRFGVAERVHFRSFEVNPLPLIREAAVLVLPSRFEGLPSVLVEAMFCGTQVVASDCPSGPAEILDNGRYGQLVPVGDAEALASALLDSLEGRFYVSPEALRARAQTFTAASAAEAYLNVLSGQRVESGVDR